MDAPGLSCLPERGGPQCAGPQTKNSGVGYRDPYRQKKRRQWRRRQKGDRLSPAWVSNIAKAKTGPANPMFGKIGKDHHHSMAVADEKTGEIHDSITQAAQSSGISVSYLQAMLSGTRPNKTSMRHVATPGSARTATPV